MSTGVTPKQRSWLVTTWLVVLFLITANVGNTLVLRQDATGYYVYLPSVLLGDWENPYWEIPGIVRRDAETGRIKSKYTYGTALFQAPFFLGAHAWVSATGGVKDGHSTPYRLGLVIGGAFYLALGCGLLYRFLRSRVGTGLAIAVPTVIWAGTSLFYYSAFMPGYSHVVSFALIAAFAHSSLALLAHPRTSRFVANGVLLGLIIAVRPTNILVLLWPLFWGINSWTAVRQRLLWLVDNIGGLSLAAIPVFLLFFPQVWYWHAVTGEWAFAAYPGESFIHWKAPRIGSVLFSVQNGLLIYAPVLLVSLYGMVEGFRRRDPFAPASLAVFLGITYMFASWWAWWFGGAFGHRAYIDFLPMLALPWDMRSVTCNTGIRVGDMGWPAWW